jgi:hypothetical protein
MVLLPRNSTIRASSHLHAGREFVVFAVLSAITVLGPSCVRPMPRATAPASGYADISHLWQEPRDIESRDLFHGPGGEALAPSATAPFTFVKADRSGYSDGYDVRGPNDLIWSVKLGPEAQPEVVASRVLWAIGFHQVPTYYLGSWTLVGKVAGPQPAARFRPDLPDRKVVADWSWYENEFVATRPFKALLVANLILNNWDWKTSNNKIYEIEGPDGARRRHYVVQDLGAALGRTTFPRFLNWFPIRGFGQGTRNDLEGFESQRLLRGVDGNDLEFDYRGIHKPLLDSVSAGDVLWTCQLLSRITDSQWDDAFRAAGYADHQRRRYVMKIKAKIAEGLRLTGRSGDQALEH